MDSPLTPATGCVHDRGVLKLRELQPDDGAAYRDLRLKALKTWPPAFGSQADELLARDPTELAGSLAANDDQVFLGAWHQAELIGQIRLSRYAGANEGHRAYLGGLYVDADRRRAGAGRALVQAALDIASSRMRVRRVNLTVVRGRQPALLLYTAMGFEIYGLEHETFAARGQYFDEWLMTRRIQAPANN